MFTHVTIKTEYRDGRPPAYRHLDIAKAEGRNHKARQEATERAAQSLASRFETKPEVATTHVILTRDGA